MTDKLNLYKDKRDFDKTPEPVGGKSYGKGKLRYSVQHHMARRDHYDLRLEWEGVLLSWAIPKGPSFDTQQKRLAVHVEDHPLDYWDFEGTIPKGQYGGGTVMLWDKGNWEPQNNVDDSLKEGTLKFVIYGERLIGKWALIKMETDDSQENWLLIKEKDEFAKQENGIEHFVTSVKTGRTMEEIAANIQQHKESLYIKNPFSHTEIQLAKLTDHAKQDNDWLYEFKYDGYRIIAYVEGGKVRFITRNGHDYTEKFPTTARALAEFSKGRAFVLDGEMVVADSTGKTDFQALQNYIRRKTAANLYYIVFDLLALDGKDLRSTPLIERKNALEKLMEGAPKNLCVSQYIRGKGNEIFSVACKAEWEGVVGKKIDSLYSGERNSDWIKIKCAKGQEFVIGGFSVSERQQKAISSFLLGYYDDDENLIYAGRVGTGFTDADRQEYFKTFSQKAIDNSAFKNPPVCSYDEYLVFVMPDAVAEVRFAEWTKENQLRQASFKGLRRDKNPQDIRKEAAIREDEKV